MERRALRLIIRGRVQGVGYRWWACEHAARLGVEGWVRNRRDGDVELVAIGRPEAVEALAAACRRGPPAAAVSAVDAVGIEDDGSTGFAERATV